MVINYCININYYHKTLSKCKIKNIIKQKWIRMILLKNKRLRYRCPVTFDREEHKCDSEMRRFLG